MLHGLRLFFAVLGTLVSRVTFFVSRALLRGSRVHEYGDSAHSMVAHALAKTVNVRPISGKLELAMSNVCIRAEEDLI